MSLRFSRLPGVSDLRLVGASTPVEVQSERPGDAGPAANPPASNSQKGYFADLRKWISDTASEIPNILIHVRVMFAGSGALYGLTRTLFRENAAFGLSSRAAFARRGAMLARVTSSYVALEERKQAVLAELSTWTDQQLRSRPSANEWSALEVLEHVVLTEEAIAATMRRNRGGAHPITIASKLRSAAVLTTMLLPARVRVPGQTPSVIPTGSVTRLGDLEDRWCYARRNLAIFLENLGGSDLESGIFEHPAGGWMSPLDTLRFLRAHQHHHCYQLQRLQSRAD